MNVFQRWKRTTIANKLMVWTTAVVAFGTVFYAGAALLQYRAAVDQAKTTAQQLQTMQAQSSVMQQQLKILEDQAASMRRQTEVIEGSLAETKRSADAAVLQASASQTAARASLQSTALALDALRPILSTKIDLDTATDDHIDFLIILENHGGGLAEARVNYCLLLDTLPKPNHTLAECPEINAKGPLQIASHQQHPLGTRLEGPAIQQVRRGKLFLFLVGVTYFRDLGQITEAPFCAVYREEFRSAGACTDFDKSEVIKQKPGSQ
jgi:hypothetical protein